MFFYVYPVRHERNTVTDDHRSTLPWYEDECRFTCPFWNCNRPRTIIFLHVSGILLIWRSFKNKLSKERNENKKNLPEMDVSENRGTTKSSILIGFSIINHPFWGTPGYPYFLETPKYTSLKHPANLSVWSQFRQRGLCQLPEARAAEPTNGTLIRRLTQPPSFSCTRLATWPLKNSPNGEGGNYFKLNVGIIETAGDIDVGSNHLTQDCLECSHDEHKVCLFTGFLWTFSISHNFSWSCSICWKMFKTYQSCRITCTCQTWYVMV